MYQEILQKIGLSVNESKVYESMLRLGLCTANQIALDSKIQRRSTYDTLKQLKEKGLCSETEQNAIRKFSAIQPQRLMDMQKEKEDLLEKSIPEMSKLFTATNPVEQTIVYKGIDSVKNVYWDMIREGKDYYTIGGRGNWLDARWKYFFPKFDQERLKKGIKYKHLFYHDLKNTSHPNHAITKILKNSQHRFLPKTFTSECSIIIYSNRVGLMSWGEEPLVVIVISNIIAEGMKQYFEFMWMNSEKGNA
jgi:HTH-type transcriptional regulator, sugar sensing transcriptional regulator